jgi:hypothetical protein
MPTTYLDEGVWGSYSATSIPVGLGVGFRERQPNGTWTPPSQLQGFDVPVIGSLPFLQIWVDVL